MSQSVLFFQIIQSSDVRDKVFGISILALFLSILKLSSCMGQTAQVVHIYQLFVQIHIDIKTVRLECINFSITKEVAKHLASTTAIVVEIDCYLSFFVHHTPDVFLSVLTGYLHSTPCLVAVYDCTFGKQFFLQYRKHFLKVVRALYKPVVYGIAANVHLVVQQAHHLAIYWGIHVILVEYEIGQQ